MSFKSKFIIALIVILGYIIFSTFFNTVVPVFQALFNSLSIVIANHPLLTLILTFSVLCGFIICINYFYWSKR